MTNKPEDKMRLGIVIILLISFNYLQCTFGETSKENARIIIIGAGPSGIAAASKLFENGFKNVKILEAENRIGGRVYTTSFGDYMVDMGAQYIDGVEGNPVYQLANPLGLVDESNETNSGIVEVFFDSEGNSVNEEIANNLYNLYFNNLHEGEFENDTMFKSVGDYTEHLFNEHFKDMPNIMNEKRKHMFHLELFTIAEAASDSWNDLSVLARNQYKEYTGDYLANWKNRGYSTVLDILMKLYPDPKKELPVKSNILLNSEVTSVDYSQETDILITTSKGEVYKADHVIMTVSLGHLKEKHSTLFRPKLPAKKIDTIEAMGYGNSAKIYVLFEKPFWSLGNKRCVQFTFIWNDADRKTIEENPEKEWLLGVVGANTVQYKPNLLEFLIAGKYNKLMEKLPEETVLNHTIENLNRFLGKRYNISASIGMMRSQWFSNPHFRGAYSYRSVESDKRNVSAAILEEPLKLQNLSVIFAGEATSSDRYGTVDGAIGTGWKAADRLIELYRNPLTSST